MTDDNVINLHPEAVGEGFKVNCDGMLEINKGRFQSLALVGIGHDGELIVAGSGGASESHFLFAQGQAFLVDFEVKR